MSGRSLGFAESATGQSAGQGAGAAVERAFSPEFRNRLDAIVRFDALSPETMLFVVDKFIAELEAQLADKRVSIRLTDAARSWLATKGHDRAFGARPLGRLIQTELKDPLVDQLLFGELVDGGQVIVDAKDDKLTLSCKRVG